MMVWLKALELNTNDWNLVDFVYAYNKQIYQYSFQ